jgi:hypothetical protein
MESNAIKTQRRIEHMLEQKEMADNESARRDSFSEASAGFRAHIPDLNIPRFQLAKDEDCYQYAERFQKEHVPPWLYDLTQAWTELYREPFKGVTSDGKQLMIRQGSKLNNRTCIHCHNQLNII